MPYSTHTICFLLATILIYLPSISAQSCTTQDCENNCARMDTPIGACNYGWQGRGSSSLSQCVCTYHDSTVAILQRCVACNNANLVVSQALGVYQAWLVICSKYAQEGQNAAVGLEQQGRNGDLVPIFSQSYLAPVQTYLCTSTSPTPMPTTTTTTPPTPIPTPNGAEGKSGDGSWLVAALVAGIVAEMVD